MNWLSKRSELIVDQTRRKTSFHAKFLCFTLSLLVPLVALLCAPARSHAGSGGTFKLPQPKRWGKRIKYKSGISAEISTVWTDGRGYRPIRIKLTVRKPKADRTIRINLVPHLEYNGFGYSEPLTYSTEVTIPEGEKSVTKTVYVPQQTGWEQLRADFFEGNRKLDDLSFPYGLGYNRRDANVGSPSVLLVDADAPSLYADRDALIRKLKKEKTKNLPDAEKFRSLRNQYYLNRSSTITPEELASKERATDDDSLEALKEIPNVEMLPPSDLPTEGIGLSSIDLIVISVDELAQLASSDEPRFRAIDDFVRNGGNLFAFGKSSAIGSKEGLEEIQARLRELFDRDLAFWKPQTSDFRAEVVTSFDEFVDDPNADVEYLLSRPAKKQGNGQQQTTRAAVLTDAPLFGVTDHGFGRVVAMDVEDPYEQHLTLWQWVLRTIGADRLTWWERHGISLVGNNTDYWDFMIPGFGASPVEGFLGVITLFIVLIGPLNYYLLKKVKRMYYLPLTVIAAALLTTISMMCYAIVSDGVATRVRLRSFTLLDQAGKENIAMTRCRQSYLAAITPSEGLVFPHQARVYPIVPVFRDIPARLEVLKDRTKERSLARGYVGARTTSQFLTTHVDTTALGLDKDGDNVANGLDVALDNLWICDEDKNFFKATDVQPKTNADLKPLGTMKEELIALDKLISDNRPEPPVGLANTNNNVLMGNTWSRWGRSRPSYLATGILHGRMSDVKKFFRNPQPNTFLIITKEAPGFVHQGTQATQEAGFHVVQGGFGS